MRFSACVKPDKYLRDILASLRVLHQEKPKVGNQEEGLRESVECAVERQIQLLDGF